MIASRPEDTTASFKQQPLGNGNSIDMKWFPDEIQRKPLSALMCAMLGGSLIMVSAVAAAQDQDAQSQQGAEQNQQAVEQDTQEKGAQEIIGGNDRLNNAPNLTREKRTLYFIGPKVPSLRQQGPSIGAPVSILPRPLVAIGSIEIPAPAGPNVEPDTELRPDEGAILNEAELTEPAGDVRPDQNQDQNQDQNSDLGSKQLIDARPDGSFSAPIGADAQEVDQSAIQEAMLEQIDPSGLPVLGLANPIDTVWQGYDRTAIQKFLHHLSGSSFSPTLTRLASSIAGSRFSLPAPADQEDILKIIEARLAVFEATANADAYTRLLGGLPVDDDWSALASHIAKAHLLKGELTDACLIAETERADDTDPYWVRLAAFCMAATGNRTGVDFQLSILEETAALEPVFYQLLDQILIEAEQPPGAVLSDPVTLNGALQTDILTVAMARLSRAQIPTIDSRGLNPLAIPLLLENPSLSIEAQSMLVTYLLERGVGEGSAIATFANSLVLQEDEADAALAYANIASIDETIVGEEGDAAETPQDLTTEEPATLTIPEDRLQTILLALIAGAGTQDQKVLAFDHFWKRALNTGKLAAAAPALNGLTRSGGYAGTQRISSDVQGSLARVAMLSGDDQVANGWSRRLRASVAGQDTDADKALVALWPLLAMQEEVAPANFAKRLNLWWQLQAENSAGFKQANLLFGIMNASGADVPSALWGTLALGPAVFEGVVVSPALWRKFEQDVQMQDPVAALTSLYQLLSEVSPADLPPAISGVLISGLRQLGFKDTARALALEILISQKL